MSVNRVTLLGHVGKQVDVKSLDGANGTKKCATFSLATTEKYKDRSGNLVENTEWHNIVSWNHAELCEKFVQKGTLLYIEGRLRTRSWDDKQGNKHYVTEILAERIQLLGNTKSQAERTPTEAPVKSTPIVAGEPQDDDLPFN